MFMYIYIYLTSFSIEYPYKATNMEELNDLILYLKCMPVLCLSVLRQCADGLDLQSSFVLVWFSCF